VLAVGTRTPLSQILPTPLYQTIPHACLQEVFADIKDGDDDDDFEVVPVKPMKTNNDFSDGLWYYILCFCYALLISSYCATVAIVFIYLLLLYM